MPVFAVQANATGGCTRRSDTPTTTSASFTAKAWLPAPPSVCRSSWVPSCCHNHACDADAVAPNTQPTMSPRSLMPSASLIAPGGFRSVIRPAAFQLTACSTPLAS